MKCATHLGYSTREKGFILKDAESKQVIVRRNVAFLDAHLGPHCSNKQTATNDESAIDHVNLRSDSDDHDNKDSENIDDEGRAAHLVHLGEEYAGGLLVARGRQRGEARGQVSLV